MSQVLTTIFIILILAIHFKYSAINLLDFNIMLLQVILAARIHRLHPALTSIGSIFSAHFTIMHEKNLMW
jgi:hypothetical protein